MSRLVSITAINFSQVLYHSHSSISSPKTKKEPELIPGMPHSDALNSHIGLG